MGSPGRRSTAPSFIEFVLDVCNEQGDNISFACRRRRLSEQVMQLFKTDHRIASSDTSPKVVKAVLGFLFQGLLPETVRDPNTSGNSGIVHQDTVGLEVSSERLRA